jgi:hypothetical protein
LHIRDCDVRHFPRNKTALDQGRRIAISFDYGQILGSRK